MIGILVTISVALFMFYFYSHVGCARPSAFGWEPGHLDFAMACATTVARPSALLAEVRDQLSFCNGAGARVFAWLSLLRFVWAYFMGFSFAHIHFQYLLFPVMPLLVY